MTAQSPASEACETCRYWKRGETYRIDPYGSTPPRIAWSANIDSKYQMQHGQCRIVAPWRSDGCFPTTYEFQGCGEYAERTNHEHR